jgi:DNA invertase Pin-like site-specific DNA recombinase
MLIKEYHSTRLLNDIKNQKINSVWIWERSRLSRNVFTSSYIFHQFKKNNIIVYEKDIKFQFDSPDREIMCGVQYLFAKYENVLNS